MKEQSLLERYLKVYQSYGKGSYTNPKSKQASFIKWADKKYRKEGSKTLLYIGCREGILLDILKQEYKCSGLDVDKKAIASARRNVKGVTFIVSDIKDFNDQKKFDIITTMDCIHASSSKESVRKMLSYMHKHLRERGLLIFSLPVCKDMWINNATNTTMIDAKGKKWIWITHNCIKEGKFILEKGVLLIDGNKVKNELNMDVLKFKYGLLGVSDILSMVNKIGFKTFVYNESKDKWDEHPNEEPIFVCIKKKSE